MEEHQELKQNLIRLRRVTSRLNTLLLCCLDLMKEQSFCGRTQIIMDQILDTRKRAIIELCPIKSKLGLAIHCPDHEAGELFRLKELAKIAKMSVSPTEIDDYFGKLFAESRTLQAVQAAQELEGEPYLMK
ncbi:MAG: hypothetical protein HUU49_03010 [Candidatus Buchananbacteria bacterium]|nr:hypothetical protein [Candidatus Buchananbacteria bacterium]